MSKHNMKKINKYLEDGCVLVLGDVGLHDKSKPIKFNSIGISHSNGGWCNEYSIKSFTWRNSIGTPPTYTNLVEVKQRNGTVYVDYVKNIDFTLELSDDNIVQWKPYIECELDWHLGGYSKFVDACVSMKPSTVTLWRNPKFYKYNQGE